MQTIFNKLQAIKFQESEPRKDTSPSFTTFSGSRALIGSNFEHDPIKSHFTLGITERHVCNQSPCTLQQFEKDVVLSTEYDSLVYPFPADVPLLF
jgi:hypothetical protein